jgi:Xaa-Pro aminopeptidase
MFPRPPLFISDDLSIPNAISRYQDRCRWLMDQCQGPIVLLAPEQGPNQRYAWANCYCPVYQDSYILFLTGINQLGIKIVLNPSDQTSTIFLPDYNKQTVFWEGDQFAFNHDASHAFLNQMGFDTIRPLSEFKTCIRSLGVSQPNWHLMIQQQGKKIRRDDHYLFKQWLSRTFKKSFKYSNISTLSWKQRLVHDKAAIDCLILSATKTSHSFKNVLSELSPCSETELCGALIGELLKQSCYGLAFSPIIAGNDNAAVLHYTNNHAPLSPGDLVLMDFGLRYQSMCSDVSRTIPIGGRYSDLQKRLMDIVLSTQEATIKQVKAGVSFDDLNQFAWDYLETELNTQFLAKGGHISRAYQRQPHNIGHHLGSQVHDGDPTS